jgi:hypothetical protein
MTMTMTLAAFVRWITHNDQRVVIPRYAIRPCHCGDRNCRGWRLVAIDKNKEGRA